MKRRMFMTNFSILWDTKVKNLALKCINPELVQILLKDESQVTDEDKDKAKEIGQKFKDPYGMYYISDMAWRVEHSLADDREVMAQLAITQVYSVLSSESYWENVWNNDTSSEEAQNLIALRDGLKELIYVNN
jgi:hypothetical protein